MKKISLMLAAVLLLSTLISLVVAVPSAAVEEMYPEGWIQPVFTWARTYWAKDGLPAPEDIHFGNGLHGTLEEGIFNNVYSGTQLNRDKNLFYFFITAYPPLSADGAYGYKDPVTLTRFQLCDGSVPGDELSKEEMMERFSIWYTDTFTEENTTRVEDWHEAKIVDILIDENGPGSNLDAGFYYLRTLTFIFEEPVTSRYFMFYDNDPGIDEFYGLYYDNYYGGMYLASDVAVETTTKAPETDPVTTDAPTTNAPTTDAPTTDAPTTDASATDAPATDAPATNAPTTDAPVTNAPDTQPGSPETGDYTIASLAIVATAAVGAVLCLKKRKD